MEAISHGHPAQNARQIKPLSKIFSSTREPIIENDMAIKMTGNYDIIRAIDIGDSNHRFRERFRGLRLLGSATCDASCELLPRASAQDGNLYQASNRLASADR